MATFTDIYKQELKNKGVLSSIGSAAFKRTLEKVDPRNILFGGKGFVSATGQKIFGKGYSGVTRAEPAKKISDGTALSNQALAQLLISSKNQEAQLSIIAKNTMNMNSMARDMNVMRQNMMKLVTMGGGKASRGADMFFKNAAARESEYESKFKKMTSPTPVGEKKTDEGKSGIFGSLMGIGGSIVTAIVGVLRGIPEIIGKVLSSVFSVSNLSKILGFSASVLGDLGSFLLKMSPILLKLAPILIAVAGANWLLNWLSNKNKEANTPEQIEKNTQDYTGSDRSKFATENLPQGAAIDYLKTFKSQREFIAETGYTKEQLQKELELAQKEKRPLRRPELRERQARLRDYERAEEQARDMEGSSQGITPQDRVVQDWRAMERTTMGTTPTKMGMLNLLDAIAKGESAGAGGYNAMNQGTVGKGGKVVGSGSSEKVIGKKLTDMTIGEILNRAPDPRDSASVRKEKGSIFAAGRYQIIPDTLRGLVKQGVVDINEKFSEEVQDRLGMALIEQTGALRLAKQGKFEEAQNALAKVWAAIPLATDVGSKKAGESYYAGPGNKASLRSGESVFASLQAMGTSGATLSLASSQASQMRTEMATAPTTTVVPVPTPTTTTKTAPQDSKIVSAFNTDMAELLFGNAVDLSGT